MEYGKRIKALREAKKISIYRLSQDSGISQGHISDLENGINQPTIETLKRILAPLGCSLSEFFNEGEISEKKKKEKELVASFRTMPDEKAELFLELGRILNQ